MRICIFGLTISSSWGNGHATLWRGLCRELHRMGHEVVFFERDVPYYARHRDLARPDGCDLRLYREWDEVARTAAAELASADAAMVTSYCPDAPAATALVFDRRPPVTVFYDLDAPVTLARLEAGEPVDYVPSGGLGAFDLVLSFTGGGTLAALIERLGARRVAPLYGSVDPQVHRPQPPDDRFTGHASYLGTYAADRQDALEALFLGPSRRMPDVVFVLGGSMYPAGVEWPPNLRRIEHVPPDQHAAFYSSCRITVNVTRGAMARRGFCPSGRLFEAAACGVPVLSDSWPGLEQFFEPGREILVASNEEEALALLALPDRVLAAVGLAARRRTLRQHTARTRALELVAILEQRTAARSGEVDACGV
jgi:spore maturation protein CgeB